MGWKGCYYIDTFFSFQILEGIGYSIRKFSYLTFSLFAEKIRVQLILLKVF